MKYKNIMFDLDSTLVSIEGIDELGRQKGLGQKIEVLTNQAMSGAIALEDVFGHRLNLIQPTLQDIHGLASTYLDHVTDGMPELIRTLQQAGYQVFIVTGGYTHATHVIADFLSIARDHVYANELLFTDDGRYLGFDPQIPLWQKFGKKRTRELIEIESPGRTLVIGDGMTDLEAAQTPEDFICFTEHICRADVVQKATWYAQDVAALAVIIASKADGSI